MLRTIQFLSPLLIALPLCGACLQDPNGEEDEQGLDEGAMSLMSDNGIELNGLQINGLQINGIQVNGLQINGLQINGLQINGAELRGIKANGASLQGSGFVGAKMPATLVGGGEVTLRIDSIEPSSDPEIRFYFLSYLNESTWKSACQAEDGTPMGAIPLRGRWDYSKGTPTGGSFLDDPSMITFGCRGAILAKCVEMGYKPWKSVTECNSTNQCHSISLRHVHQACTRMLRADYCGDGKPHTRNGTPINIWDPLGIQAPDPVGWPLEAEWTEEGASCVAHVRWTSDGAEKATLSRRYIRHHCPEKRAPSALEACGSASSSFLTAQGFSVPLVNRSVLRNASYVPPDAGTLIDIDEVE